MAVAVLCGLALGLVLNIGADWLPRRVLLLADDAAAPAGQDAVRPSGQRLLRWGALLLLSVGLVAHLRSAATAGRNSGPSLLVSAVPALTYCSLLLLIAIIDLEHRLVPNVLILAGLLVAASFSLLATRHSSWLAGVPGLASAVTGAAVGGGLFLLLALARRNALGAGDVKLAFLIGMLTGFPRVVQALVLGILLGGLAAALLLLFRLRGRKEYIPYAPYLVAGAVATLLYGQRIAQWYAQLGG